MLFVAMALAPLHNAMLVGMDLPHGGAVLAQARRCASIFCDGSRV